MDVFLFLIWPLPFVTGNGDSYGRFAWSRREHFRMFRKWTSPSLQFSSHQETCLYKETARGDCWRVGFNSFIPAIEMWFFPPCRFFFLIVSWQKFIKRFIFICLQVTLQYLSIVYVSKNLSFIFLKPNTVSRHWKFYSTITWGISTNRSPSSSDVWCCQDHGWDQYFLPDLSRPVSDGVWCCYKTLRKVNLCEIRVCHIAYKLVSGCK